MFCFKLDDEDILPNIEKGDCATDISGGKRKAPPKAEKLVDHHLDVVKDTVSKYPGHPLVLVGKSMGSR